MTFSPGFFSRGIRRTVLKPKKGLKICATSRSVASKGIPSTYTVFVAFFGIGKIDYGSNSRLRCDVKSDSLENTGLSDLANECDKP